MRQQEKRQAGAENTQRRRHEEGILARASGVRSIVLNDGEDISSDEGANLAGSGRDGVVLATNRGGAGLGRHEPDVVAGAQFAERQEDSVDDDESGNVVGGCEFRVCARHREADNTLGGYTPC